MFAYLNKKVEIPNKIRLHCVSWNSEQGWISCGGENGLLKVLKLDPDNPQGGGRGLSYNHSVAGHKTAVTKVSWNEHYRKLTTADSTGLIMVWIYANGRWFEEMINNRGKAPVADLKWTSDGKQICIAYEDGAIILGSVDGKRIWGIELPYHLKCTAWSPDSKILLLVSQNGEVNVHDEKSNFLKRLATPAIDDVPGTKVSCIDWYDGAEGWVDPAAPTLAVGFENGRVQLMRSESDDQPVLVDTGMETGREGQGPFARTEGEWVLAGVVVALCWRGDRAVARKVADGGQVEHERHGAGLLGPDLGRHPGQRDRPESRRPNNQIQFYSPFGLGGGQRLAIALDSCIYFATIKMEYKYFDGVVVYAFTRPDQSKHFCQFWDTRTDEKVLKQVQNVQLLVAGGQNCCLVTRLDDGTGQFILILCNAIGSPVETKYIEFEPQFACMSATHVVVASGSLVYVWN
ncbi:putative voltage-gated potassium channel subunit beta [Paratrimastix pyriformis]|uniref:Voltage-gated potassium channel subunit beta n=1 Tax=Paratrimastix pyriformis TaxID=342808 RepID=A0ABQ8UMT1_9EUKA|nr:putative voltage-gated potassium channel subunit beta [Paratrimastix pyriformis]